MIDPDIQRLLDAPLDGEDVARINKPWLPMGKRSAPRAAKPEYHGEESPALTPRQLRERRDTERAKRMGSVLMYYATTDIPFERIAQHTGLDIEEVARRMKDMGRDA